MILSPKGIRKRAERSDTTPNYRNGYSRKRVKTQLGEVEIRASRGRKGTFEPKIIGKYSRNAEGMEENLLQFGEKWRRQYPSCVKSWEVLSTFYEYPPKVRKIIYTTTRRTL